MVSQVVGGLEEIRSVLRRHSALVGATSWVTGAFLIQQLLRLGTGVTLAWLLAPELLGTMVLINVLRTGGELLTDVGLGQSIIKDPEGGKPDFYNTAWTIQIIRGLILFSAGVALTGPINSIYTSADLSILLPSAALIFIITGFISPAPFLLQKQSKVAQFALFSTWTAVASSVVHIVLALITPTIWALIGGLLVSSLISVVGSYFLIRDLKHAVKLDVYARRSIFTFGKWVFASSLIYFAAMNFDRLYFAQAVPLALLGIYGIARTLTDAAGMLFQRVGSVLIFPKVSASNLSVLDLRVSIAPLRKFTLVALALGLAGAVAFADVFIDIAYDHRYAQAAVFLPIMLVGAWFSVLATISDAMMMGIGRPSAVALANGARLLFVILAVPAILPLWGMVAAVGALSVAEAVRYAVLALTKRVHGLSFFLQDLSSTALFLILIFVVREVTGLVGVTEGVAGWIAQAKALHL